VDKLSVIADSKTTVSGTVHEVSIPAEAEDFTLTFDKTAKADVLTANAKGTISAEKGAVVTAATVNANGVTIAGSAKYTTLTVTKEVTEPGTISSTTTGKIVNESSVAIKNEKGGTLVEAGGRKTNNDAGDNGSVGGNGGSTVATVTDLAILGVTAPVAGATPVTTISNTAEYTGTVAWSGTPTTFAYGTAYTATITLAAKTNYTFTGVATDSFTVAGATATNPADGNVVTAVFPATAVAPQTGASLVFPTTATATNLGTATDLPVATGTNLATVTNLGGVSALATTADPALVSINLTSASVAFGSLKFVAVLDSSSDKATVTAYVGNATEAPASYVALTQGTGTGATHIYWSNLTVAPGDVIWVKVVSEDSLTTTKYKLTVS
jgi:hypothetical protein